MKRSDNINEIAAALAKAQAQIEGAVKGNLNPAFRSKYADLGAVWDAIRRPLTEAGISVVQELLSHEDRRIGCMTLLMHASGQFIEFEPFWLTPVKHDPQGAGSCATYCRRYSLMAATGIAPIDDDGNAASQPAKPPHPAMAAEAPMPDYSVQEKALRECATLQGLQAVWKALSAAERRALSSVKDQVKATIEMADAAAADA